MRIEAYWKVKTQEHAEVCDRAFDLLMKTHGEEMIRLAFKSHDEIAQEYRFAGDSEKIKDQIVQRLINLWVHGACRGIEMIVNTSELKSENEMNEAKEKLSEREDVGPIQF